MHSSDDLAFSTMLSPPTIKFAPSLPLHFDNSMDQDKVQAGKVACRTRQATLWHPEQTMRSFPARSSPANHGPVPSTTMVTLLVSCMQPDHTLSQDNFKLSIFTRNNHTTVSFSILHLSWSNHQPHGTRPAIYRLIFSYQGR